MKITFVAGFLAALSLFSPFSLAAAPSRSTFELDTAQLKFRYQRNVEPWEAGTCTHRKSSTGLFEWDVECTTERTKTRYHVHLVLSFYPKTIHGTSAYELLYWVTDITGTTPIFDSTTVWVHNSEEANRARVIEASQGVENDLSSLWLTLKLNGG